MCGWVQRGSGPAPGHGELRPGLLLQLEGAAPSPVTLTQAQRPLLPGRLLPLVLREHGAEVPVSCPCLQAPIRAGHGGE